MAYTSGAGETCERYPSNNLAVLRVRVDGGLFSVFFEDGAHPQKVLGSFDPLGVGFVVHQSTGLPAFVTTRLGGRICDPQGNFKEQWMWHKPPRGPRAPPFRHALNNLLTLECHGQFDCEVLFRSGRGAAQSGTQRFYVGAPKSKAAGSHYDPSLTLQKRQELLAQKPGGDQVERAQMFHWQLPRISVAMANTIPLELPDLGTVTANNDWFHELKERHTSAVYQSLAQHTKNGATLTEAMQTAVAASSIWKTPHLEVEKVKLPKERPLVRVDATADRLDHPQLLKRWSDTRRGGRGLKVIKTKQLPRALRDARSDQIVVVCCSNRTTTQCRFAEKMLLRVQSHWLSELAQTKYLGSSSRPPTGADPAATAAATAAPGAPGGEAGATRATSRSSLTRSSLGAGKVAKASAHLGGANPMGYGLGSDAAAPARGRIAAIADDALETMLATLPAQIVVVDCGASEELAKRYNFCVYPMFFMYMDSRLVYASKTLNGFGVEPEDCVAQVEKCIVDGQRGRFLPENFKFADKHEASFASVFDLH